MLDVIDTLAGIDPDSPLAALRRRREDYVRYSQGSHDVLLLPAHPGGLSCEERAAAALHVAVINENEALIAHYRSLVPTPMAADIATTPRMQALLAHVEMVARSPRNATPAHLEALQAAGFSPRDIVVVSQLIAFVSYQARVLAGLRLLQQETAA